MSQSGNLPTSNQPYGSGPEAAQQTKERTEECGGFAGYEVRNAYPCGCVAVVCRCGCDSLPEIIQCSLHAQAGAVRAALEGILEWYKQLPSPGLVPNSLEVTCRLREARAILRAIEGA